MVVLAKEIDIHFKVAELAEQAVRQGLIYPNAAPARILAVVEGVAVEASVSRLCLARNLGAAPGAGRGEEREVALRGLVMELCEGGSLQDQIKAELGAEGHEVPDGFTW